MYRHLQKIKPVRLLASWEQSSSSVEINGRCVKNRVVINTVTDPFNADSNKQCYEKLEEFIREKAIKNIDVISDKFKLKVDYSIKKDNCDVERFTVMKDVIYEDKAFVLGINEENESVYRRVRCMNPIIKLQNTVRVPQGISECMRSSYTININSIELFQYKSDDVVQVNPSIYDTPLKCNCSLVRGDLAESICVYSSLDDNIVFQPITVKFVPSLIELDIKILLSNLIVAYNNETIDEIVIENNVIDSGQEIPSPQPQPSEPSGDDNSITDNNQTDDNNQNTDDNQSQTDDTTSTNTDDNSTTNTSDNQNDNQSQTDDTTNANTDDNTNTDTPATDNNNNQSPEEG